jgi:hypothetical protein
VLLERIVGLSREQPVLLIFEDAQWADATSLEPLELLAARIARHRVLAVITSRPDFAPQTRPVDPRDFLRGDYVALNYDISQVPAGPLQNEPASARNPIVFVKLAPNRDGLYEAVSVHADAVAVKGPEVLIRGRVAYGATCGPGGRVFCDKLQIRYNLESYFVPEGEGLKLQQLRDRRKLMVVAAVMPSGRAAIKRLLVDGEPVYDEPWF